MRSEMINHIVKYVLSSRSVRPRADDFRPIRPLQSVLADELTRTLDPGGPRKPDTAHTRNAMILDAPWNAFEPINRDSPVAIACIANR